MTTKQTVIASGILWTLALIGMVSLRYDWGYKIGRRLKTWIDKRNGWK